MESKDFRRHVFRNYSDNKSGHIDPCMWNNNHHFDERSLSRPFLLLYALIANYVFHTVKTDPSLLNEWVKCHHNRSIPDDYTFSSPFTKFISIICIVKANIKSKTNLIYTNEIRKAPWISKFVWNLAYLIWHLL